MTDVRTEPSPTRTETKTNPQGGFIWYELMTNDAEAREGLLRRGGRLEHRSRRSRI